MCRLVRHDALRKRVEEEGGWNCGGEINTLYPLYLPFKCHRFVQLGWF